ncbi:MAG: stage II sporulation protein R [Limnochordales bacterium]
MGAMARRGVLVALVAALTLLALLAWRWTKPHVLHAYEAVPVVRLHVVAHSDAPRDQDMKLAVRDAVLPLILQLAADAPSPDAAHQRLLAAGDEIARAARAVVAEWGAPYPVTVAGQWDAVGEPVAVRIVIGEGRGRNWFCVLFPPLCFAEGAGAVQPAPRARAAPATADEPPLSDVPEPYPPAAGPVRVALRWLESGADPSLPLDGVGQVDQDDVHTDLAHALPRDGHIGPAAE